MALTSRPKGDKISKQQGAGEVSQYIQHKRGAGRCKAPWTWPKGAREQWGGNAPPVSRRYRVRVSPSGRGRNSGGTTDKRKCGARDCEGAWTGARARAGPQGGPWTSPSRRESDRATRPLRSMTALFALSQNNLAWGIFLSRAPLKGAFP